MDPSTARGPMSVVKALVVHLRCVSPSLLQHLFRCRHEGARATHQRDGAPNVLPTHNTSQGSRLHAATGPQRSTSGFQHIFCHTPQRRQLSGGLALGSTSGCDDGKDLATALLGSLLQDAPEGRLLHPRHRQQHHNPTIRPAGAQLLQERHQWRHTDACPQQQHRPLLWHLPRCQAHSVLEVQVHVHGEGATKAQQVESCTRLYAAVQVAGHQAARLQLHRDSEGTARRQHPALVVGGYRPCPEHIVTLLRDCIGQLPILQLVCGRSVKELRWEAEGSVLPRKEGAADWWGTDLEGLHAICLVPDFNHRDLCGAH
mmetsp:Transcript_8520/g.24442  ORF Transcript_8520/g.24442 Transcript_8520/m.24442 type:complete len:315 (+) Transcript_8520:164-1108(+)